MYHFEFTKLDTVRSYRAFYLLSQVSSQPLITKILQQLLDMSSYCICCHHLYGTIERHNTSHGSMLQIQQLF